MATLEVVARCYTSFQANKHREDVQSKISSKTGMITISVQDMMRFREVVDEATVD